MDRWMERLKESDRDTKRRRKKGERGEMSIKITSLFFSLLLLLSSSLNLPPGGCRMEMQTSPVSWMLGW